MKKYTSVLIMILIVMFAQAQTAFKLEEVYKDAKTNIQILKPKEFISATPANEIWLIKSLLTPGTKSRVTVKLEKTFPENGDIHNLYAFYYAGILLKGADFAIHSKNGKIFLTNGLIPRIESDLDILPKITVSDAEKNAEGSFLLRHNINKNGQSISAQNKDLVFFYKENKAVLSYIIETGRSKGWTEEFNYINASTGEILLNMPIICKAYSTEKSNLIGQSDLTKNILTPVPPNATARGASLYSGLNLRFTSDSYSGQFRLWQKPDPTQATYIKTLNGNYKIGYDLIEANATDFFDADNLWTAAEHPNDKQAIDVHWGNSLVYSYFQTEHNRQSFDNYGGDIKGYVHSIFEGGGDPAHNNAFWHPQKQAFFYGDGAGAFTPWVSLDLCAHEYGHGVAQFSTAQLPLSLDPLVGAISEGFSDIWGATVEKYYFNDLNNPNVSKQNWRIFEEFEPSHQGLRIPKSPSSIGHPDSYQGNNWNFSCVPGGECGKYTNCDLLNHWYYLVVEGGDGWNGNGTSHANPPYPPNSFHWSVTGIGLQKAAQIVYKTLQLLTPQSVNWFTTRDMSIQAAQILFGSGSAEEIAVTNAWCAVGLSNGNCCFNTAEIVGSESVCSEGIYSITTPQGTSVTWSTNQTPPVILTSVTPTPPYTSSVRVKPNGYLGQFTLTATITGGSCGTVQSSKSITASSGQAPSCSTRHAYQTLNGYQTNLYGCTFLTQLRYVDGNPMNGQEYYTTAWVEDLDPYAIISWSFVSASGNSAYLANGANVEVFINTHSPNGWIRLRCTTSNVCGSYSRDYWFTPQGSSAKCQVPGFDPNCIIVAERPAIITEPGLDKILLSPNPTNGQFKISLVSDEKDAFIRTIRIRTKMGVQVYQQDFKNSQKEQLINLFSLPTDIYMVEVFDGKKWITEKLSLQR